MRGWKVLIGTQCGIQHALLHIMAFQLKLVRRNNLNHCRVTIKLMLRTAHQGIFFSKWVCSNFEQCERQLYFKWPLIWHRTEWVYVVNVVIMQGCSSKVYTLRWRHNDHDGVSNHQPHDCLLNRLFGCRSKKTPKLRVTGLCAGNSPGTGEFPHKWPITRNMLPFDDVIMRGLYGVSQ